MSHFFPRCAVLESSWSWFFIPSFMACGLLSYPLAPEAALSIYLRLCLPFKPRCVLGPVGRWEIESALCSLVTIAMEFKWTVKLLANNHRVLLLPFLLEHCPHPQSGWLVSSCLCFPWSKRSKTQSHVGVAGWLHSCVWGCLTRSVRLLALTEEEILDIWPSGLCLHCLIQSSKTLRSKCDSFHFTQNQKSLEGFDCFPKWLKLRVVKPELDWNEMQNLVTLSSAWLLMWPLADLSPYFNEFWLRWKFEGTGVFSF